MTKKVRETLSREYYSSFMDTLRTRLYEELETPCSSRVFATLWSNHLIKIETEIFRKLINEFGDSRV